MKILILYYSRTGNTEKMVEEVLEGARTVSGVKAESKIHVLPEDLSQYDAVVVGVPTYHHDMNFDIKNLFEEAAAKNVSLKGKVGAAFGSYGWSGEAPRLVLEIMKNKFGMDVVEPPLLIRYEPDEAGKTKCRDFGKSVAEKLIHKS